MALCKIWRVVVHVFHQNFDGLVDLEDTKMPSAQPVFPPAGLLLAVSAVALTGLEPTLLHCTHTSRVELDRAWQRHTAS